MADAKYAPAPTEPPPPYNPAQAAPAASASATPTRAPPTRLPLPLEHPALVAVRGKRVILASASPRRRQLLAQIGLNKVEIVPSTVPEDLPKSLSPFEYVVQTAMQKGLTVYKQEINSPNGEPALIIAADTVVVSHLGVILEKPRSEKDHIAMLKTLRDEGEHKVYTGIAIMAPLENARDPGYALESAVEETSVQFDRKLTDAELMNYVKTREGADKAGGYGIQGIGTILVERIEGSFDNVVGLPLRTTLKLIDKVIKQASEEDTEEEFDDLVGGDEEEEF